MLCACSIVSALHYRVEQPGLAPFPGEHNEAVFVGLLGHAKDELEQWREAGII